MYRMYEVGLLLYRKGQIERRTSELRSIIWNFEIDTWILRRILSHNHITEPALKISNMQIYTLCKHAASVTDHVGSLKKKWNLSLVSKKLTNRVSD